MGDAQKTEKAAETWASLGRYAKAAGIAVRTARRQAAAQRNNMVVRLVAGRGGLGGKRYEILVSSLPIYLQQRLAAPTAAALPREAPNRPTSWSQEERDARHDAFSRLPKRSKEKAHRAALAVRVYRQFDGTDVPTLERYKEAANQAGVSPRSVAGYVKRCADHDPGDWPVALAPSYDPKPPKAAFSEEAWRFICGEYFQLTKPKLKPIFWRALREAAQRGWSVPSYSTVKRRIEAVPPWQHTLKREGAKAFERLYPTQQRDYSGLEVHGLWCSDGWQADVWVRWEDGTVDRPIVMAWLDVRTRVAVGFEVGHTESTDLVRRSFRAAVIKAKALPSAALLDNGRAYASYEVSGGAPNRFRFQFDEGDPLGFLVLCGCEIVWASPGNARAKPIESWHRTLAEMARRHGPAYCGNKPDARPEDADRASAVPMSEFRRVLEQTIDDYHARPHRGDAMEGRCPLDVYRALIESTKVKRPTAAQLRILLQAAAKIKLDPRDHSVTILGNRYWTPELAELPDGRFYTVRYNPDDASEPVAVYERDRYLFDARLIDRSGFRDRDRAREHARSKRRFLSSLKERDEALTGMRGARHWLPTPAEMQAGGSLAPAELPVSKIVQPLHIPRAFMPIDDEKERRRAEAERVRAELFGRKVGGG